MTELREFTKNTLSLGWGLTMVGVQEAVHLLTTPKEKSGRTKQSTGSPAEELTDLYKAAYEAGDQAQKELVDGVAHYLSSITPTDPSSMLRLGNELLWDLSENLRFLIPRAEGVDSWQELMNKMEVYQLVRSIHEKLKIPRDGEIPLPELVNQAYELGTFEALWALEGLGHDYADAVRQKEPSPAPLLKGKQIQDLPEGSLLMLHAGMGLSFAQHLLKNFTSTTPDEEIESAVTHFLQLCRDHSQKGYGDASVESLGLVTRTFHSELVPGVDRCLKRSHEEALGLFWHGVGRAGYFLLVNFLPYGNPVWRAIEMGRREAPHEVARHNWLAGTAWALTLVNMRHPRVFQTLLREHGEEIVELEGFSNGIVSSVIMRQDTTPGVPFLTEFGQGRPEASEERLSELWDHIVKSSVDRGIQYHGFLKKKGRLDQVFQYRNLDEVVRS